MTLSIADAKERKEALDPTRSFLVQAPAGSGKTELLIQRCLMLLGGVEYPEQILAMTFTRKAAGEMKNRIIDALHNARDNTPADKPHLKETRSLALKALEQDNKNGWRLLENPNRLKVQTIDSFCAGLIKQMPILSWMGGSPSIQENAYELYRETAERLLKLLESESETGERIRTVLRHLDNSKDAFLRRVIQLLQKRDQWMIPFFEKFTLGETSRASLEETFAKLIESALKELHSLCPQELKDRLPSYAAFAGKNMAEENPDHTLSCLAELTTFPEPSIEFLHQWKALAELLLTAEGEARKTANKNIGFPADQTETAKTMKLDFLNLLESLTEGGEFMEKLHGARRLPESRLRDDDWSSDVCSSD
ncbi:MAG: UvrD-helicase domain-containing protein, partial [Nitrospinaceae bacterium]